MISVLIILIILFYIGVECGKSWPWSSNWQNKKHWYSSVPEWAAAIILGGLASSVWGGYQWLVIAPFILVSYAGIQAATWPFIQWTTKHPSFDAGRSFTLKPIVDWIAGRANIKQGTRKYSWIAATVKGTILTLPAGGLGGVFFALGYEIKSRIPRKHVHFNPMIISEGLSFMFVGVYYFLFITIVGKVWIQ